MHSKLLEGYRNDEKAPHPSLTAHRIDLAPHGSDSKSIVRNERALSSNRNNAAVLSHPQIMVAKKKESTGMEI